jgi:hypothetical protein
MDKNRVARRAKGERGSFLRKMFSAFATVPSAECDHRFLTVVKGKEWRCRFCGETRKAGLPVPIPLNVGHYMGESENDES